MRQREDIGIARDDQGRCLDAGDLLGEVESFFIASPILSNRLGKSSGLGARLAYS
jgi:hypothetical protein